MMRAQNKETFKRVLLWSGMVVCLFLAGCRDKSVDHYNWGIAYAKEGKYDKAIYEFTTAIEFNPRFAEAYCNRGLACKNKGEYDQAISDCSKAIEINPGYAMAYYNRGNAYLFKGQNDLAISDYTKSLEIKPRLAKAYNNRGLAYYYKREYDKAWEDVHKVQSLGQQIHPEFLKILREASGREG